MRVLEREVTSEGHKIFRLSDVKTTKLFSPNFSPAATNKSLWATRKILSLSTNITSNLSHSIVLNFTRLYQLPILDLSCFS